MTDIVDFVNRAAHACGFLRERYTQRNMPTSPNNIEILPFFGDTRSEFILSTILLHRYHKEVSPSKYLIVASWKGHGGIFPYADEYWGIKEEGRLYDTAMGFVNKDAKMKHFYQTMNLYFSNVVMVEDFAKYYNDGLTKDFFDTFKWVLYNLPAVSSSSLEFNREVVSRAGYKIFIHPTRVVKSWRKGHECNVGVPIEFWVSMGDFFAKRGYVPVMLQDHASYNMSAELLLKESNISLVLGAMRTVGCVLDVFNGTSRMAMMARCPFVCVAERQRMTAMKERELDCLCGNDIPKQYLYSFTNLIEGKQWVDLFEQIAGKLDAFVPTLDREKWPGTGETSVVAPYSLVTMKRHRKIGSRFIKVPKCL